MKKKILSFILTIALVLSVCGATPFTAGAADSPLSMLTYSSATDVFEVFACADDTTVRIVNGGSIYQFNPKAGAVSTIYTFPEPENSPKGVTGVLSGVDRGARAYLDQNTGMLYYARSKYKFSNSESMVISVYVYDIELCRLVSTYEVKGAELLSVGEGPDGVIFIGTRENSLGSKDGLVILDAKGNEIGRMEDTDENPFSPIDSFEGYSEDGTFYFIVRNTVKSPYGYDNTMGELGVGSLKDGTISLNSTGLTVKNISFADYGSPTVWLEDGRLMIWNGELVDFSTYTYTVLNRDFTQDQSYSFTNHATANAVQSGSELTVLTGDRLITEFDSETLEQKKMFLADKNIFTFFGCDGDWCLIYKENDAFSYEIVPRDSFSEITETVLNLNEQSVYSRTKEDIVKAYVEAVPADYDAPFFETEGSYTAPYKEYTLTAETRENALRYSNYIRWLAGETPFTAAADDVWDRAAKGALLSQVNVSLTHQLSHSPEKPEDMDETFYQDGYTATTSSNLASAYFGTQTSILSAVRMFMNDRGYTMPGHRNTFLTRNGDRLAIGYAPGGAAQTVQYTGSPNPGGTAVYNNEAAYAWPSPGYFPADEIATYSVWSITLNTDEVRPYTNLRVTVTDLDTGEEFVRESSEIDYTTYWGTTFAFAPPTADSYEGKRYEVKFSGLADAMGLPASIAYTVEFFSYAGEYEIDGTPCVVDSYGRLTAKEEPTTAEPATEPTTEPQPAIKLGDVNLDGAVDITDATQIQLYAAGLADFSDVQLAAADVSRDGAVDVTDATQIQLYAAGLITDF